jgi:tetratricopeptide (TPR) repeat protein
LLAHHWGVAGDRDKWLVCLERAGDKAMALGANHEAVSFFDQALRREDLAGADNLRRAHWHGQVGEAWYLLGNLGKSRYHLEEALRLLGKPLPRTGAGWALRGLREISAQGVLLIAGARLPRSSVTNQRRLREASRLMSILSEQFYFAVDIRKMVVSLLSTINLAERTEMPETASRAYGTLGYVVGLLRLHRLSRLYFHRGRRGLDAGAHVNAAVGAALYHLAFGRWSACLAALEEGRAHAEAVGDTFGIGLCLNVLGDAQHLIGAFPEATAAYETLVANARARSNTQHEVWGLSGCAETLLSQGRIEEAEQRLRECARVMPLVADRDRLSAFRHEGVKAAILLRLEDAAGAAAALDEALRLHRADPTPMYATYWAVVSILETSLALWRRHGGTGQLLIAVRDTSRLMKRFATFFPIARSRYTLLLGHRHWLAGDQAAATRRWRQEEAIGTRLEMRHEISLAREALAHPSRVGAMIGAETEQSPFDQQITW